MVLLIEYGRLGNQLFQVAGIKHLLPDHKIVCLGCAALEMSVKGTGAVFIKPNRIFKPLLFHLLARFLVFLSKMRIVGSIHETRSQQDSTTSTVRGLFRDIFVSYQIYFQHTDIIDKFEVGGMAPRKLAEAESWLSKKGISPCSADNLVFVQIRRSDYCFWPSKEHPAVLELEWYQNAIEHIRENITNPIFIVVTDDYHYAKEFLIDAYDVLLSDCDVATDLALMSLCRHGILSASSLAWWGAFYAHQKDNGGIFLAPKYWAGHRSQTWYPRQFKTDWITYIEGSSAFLFSKKG